MSSATALTGASTITVPVPLGDRAYDILVGRGILRDAGVCIAALIFVLTLLINRIAVREAAR